MDKKEEHIIEGMHLKDEMCLDNLKHTHGSFITAGSTAYSIVQKLEFLFDEFKKWFVSLLEKVTQEEVYDMWHSPGNEVTFEDGYLMGAIVDRDGYIILDGITIDEQGYIQLK